MSTTPVPVDVIGVAVAAAPAGADPEAPLMPVVLLREIRGACRWLPIAIGRPEAEAIMAAQVASSAPRPSTIELLSAVLVALDGRLSRVELTDLRDGVFYADLVFEDGLRVSARPSDAIALALRAHPPLPVAAADHVLVAAGVDTRPIADPGAAWEEDDPSHGPDEVDRFRAFLDTITAEDFDRPEQ